MDHLHALKRYLLMGRGDFALCLMDAMQPELKARASTIFRHHLVSKLEHAIRSSSAQFDDPSILKRLDVRLLESSPGERGWDIFLLDYSIQPVSGQGSTTRTPLSAVLTPDAMKSYHKVFAFLWQLKRVEHSLVVRRVCVCVCVSLTLSLSLSLSLPLSHPLSHPLTRIRTGTLEESYTCCQERSRTSGVKQCRTQVQSLTSRDATFREQSSQLHHVRSLGNILGRVVQRNANRKRFRQCHRSS